LVRPLESHTGLFRDFAQLATTRDAILAFADEHGHLLERQHAIVPAKKRKEAVARLGEGYEAWRDAIAEMKTLVAIWEAMAQRDVVALGKWILWRGDGVFFERSEARSKRYKVIAGRGPTPERFEQIQRGDLLLPALMALQDELNEHFADQVSATIPRLIMTPNGDLQLVIRPSSLLAALWLQFAQAVAANYQLRICQGCGKYFQVGAGALKRADATTCSGACRQRAKRNRDTAAKLLERRKRTGPRKAR
jgi:hypothetical protein